MERNGVPLGAFSQNRQRSDPTVGGKGWLEPFNNTDLAFSFGNKGGGFLKQRGSDASFSLTLQDANAIIIIDSPSDQRRSAGPVSCALEGGNTA